MTLKNRFTLVGTGIIIFLIITPALILFARGFTIDWNARQIVKTGAIVVRTDPGGATIFLNNKQQASLTPSNIRFLTPGEYDIRIEKSGYQSWSKRLTVKAQLVTWADPNRESRILFLKIPKLQQSWTASQTSISKNGNEIIFLDNGKASSLNTNEGIVTNLGAAATPQIPLFNQADWQNGQAVFLALQNPNKLGLSSKQLEGIQQIEITGTHVVAKIGLDLFALDKSVLLPLDKNVTTFTLEDDSIWYIQGNLLKRFDYDSGNTEIINKTAPPATSGRIIRANNQIYAVLKSTLYVLNDGFEKIYDNVTKASWDQEAKLLTFGNNNEILTYNPASKRTDLILRSASQIKNPVLNWADGYVFFENGKLVKAIELDDRDHRNIYTVANLPDDQSSFAVSTDGRTLYIFNNTKIDKLNIRQLETGFIQSFIDQLVS